MLFTKMRQIVELNHKGIGSVEAVVSVPCYFSDAQRRAVREAATIGGLNCLRVLNDGTATALSYGIFRGAKKEFPEDKETPVLFLDMGYSQFTATAAVFTNTSLRVLATATDAAFGGRDIDAALAQEFSRQFSAGKGKGCDAWGNKKARLKLLAAAEKAKITLSPHGVNEAPINVECLMNDADFTYTLTVEKLDELVAEKASAVISRVIASVLATAGLTGAKDFAAVEMVGGSMRPRFVKRAAAIALSMTLDEPNGHGLSQSLNLDEACTRGCALASAMLSPMFKVKQFDTTEACPWGIRVSWEGGATTAAASERMEEEGDAAAAAATGGAPNATAIFKLGDASPSTHQVKNLKVTGEAPLVFTAEYEGGSLAASVHTIGQFKVDLSGPSVAAALTEAAASGLSPPKVKVDFKVDINGCLTCPSAVLVKEVPVVAEEAAAVTTTPAAAPGADAAGTPMAVETGAAAGAEAAAAAAAGGKPKKKFSRVNLPVPSFSLLGGLTPTQLAAACEAEKVMIGRDAEIHATQDMRNSLEAAIYSTRGALEESLQPFSTAKERDELGALLGSLEEWLYNEGFSTDKATYKGKLEELTGKAGRLQRRRTESEGRYAAVSALQETIARFKACGDNSTGKHGHLGEADRDTLKSSLGGAERWLAESQAAQKAKEATEDPVLTCADLNSWRDRLEKELGPIERRPLPAPVKVEAPPTPTAAPAVESAAGEGATPAAAPSEGTEEMKVD